MTDHRLRDAMTAPSDRNEPIDSAEPKLPIEPIEKAEPTEPIEQNDPLLAMQRNEPSDHSDHLDVDDCPTGPWCPIGPHRG